MGIFFNAIYSFGYFLFNNIDIFTNCFSICKLPQKLYSLKDDKVTNFKLYEKVKIYLEPDHQGSKGP